MADEKPLDTTIDIVTPENIAFEYQVAGPVRRFPAYMIDLLIRFAVMLVLMVVVQLFAATFLVYFGLALLLVGWFALEWFYGGLFEALWNGQTPGKRAMGLRVLTAAGQPISGGQAIMRNVLRLVDMAPFIPAAIIIQAFAPPPVMQLLLRSGLPTFMVGLLVAMSNRRMRRAGDLVAGTMVIVEERSWLRGVVRFEDPRARQLAAYLPANLEVSRSLAKALSTYVERRRFFSPARLQEIARHLGEPLVVRFGLARDTSHDLLLCALYYRTFIADHVEELEATRPTGPAPPPSSIPFDDPPHLPQIQVR